MKARVFEETSVNVYEELKVIPSCNTLRISRILTVANEKSEESHNQICYLNEQWISQQAGVMDKVPLATEVQFSLVITQVIEIGEQRKQTILPDEWPSDLVSRNYDERYPKDVRDDIITDRGPADEVVVVFKTLADDDTGDFI